MDTFKEDKLFGLFENIYNKGEFSWPFCDDDACDFVKIARRCKNKEDFFNGFLNDYIFYDTKNYVDNKCPYSLVNEGVIEYENQIEDLFYSDLEAQEMNFNFLKKIESWEYIDIIASALFYILKKKIDTKHLSTSLWDDICSLVSHPILGEEIFILLKRNAFVEYNPDLAVFGIGYFLSIKEISFAFRNESSGLNENALIRLLSLLDINQVEIEQLIETALKENSLNAIVSFLETYSVPNPKNDYISLEELKDFLSLLQKKNDQDTFDEIASELENFQPFDITASYDDIFLVLNNGIPLSLFPTVLPNFFQQAFRRVTEIYLAKEEKIIEQFTANTLKNKAEKNFNFILKKDVLLKGKKLAEIISELKALGFATFPKKQDIFAYLENLSHEEFETISNEVLEKYDLISIQNLENLKKSKEKFKAFLALILLFICHLGGPSFLISKSNNLRLAASIPLVTVSLNPNAINSNQLVKSTSSISFTTTKEVKLGEDKTPYELQISRDDTNKTITAFGTFIPYRFRKQVNKLIQREMGKYPGYAIIKHEWDHPLIASLQEALLWKTKEKKTDPSSVCAIDSRSNKLRAEERFFLTIREKYNYQNGALPLLLNSMSAPREHIKNYINGQVTLQPYRQILESASLKQESQTEDELKLYFKESGIPKHLQLFCLEQSIEHGHLPAEHAVIRVQTSLDLMEECMENHVQRQVAIQSLWNLMPNKSCSAAIRLSLRMQEQNVTTAITLDTIISKAKMYGNFQASKTELAKLERWQNMIYQVPKKLHSAERINEENIVKKCYSSQGKQGRLFSDLSNKKI